MLVTKFAPLIGFGSVVALQLVKASSIQFGKISRFFLEKEACSESDSWKATAYKAARWFTCSCHVLINSLGLAIAAGCTAFSLATTVWLVSTSISLGSGVATAVLGVCVVVTSLACTILLGKFLLTR